MAADGHITFLRVELPAEEVSILDGYCQATGESRTSVIRQLLREWSNAKIHEATVILRMARVNPGGPHFDRTLTGGLLPAAGTGNDESPSEG